MVGRSSLRTALTLACFAICLLAQVGCNQSKPAKLEKIGHEVAISIAHKFIGKISRESPQIGVDSSRLVFIECTFDSDFQYFKAVFHDSLFAMEVSVHIDSMSHPEIYLDQFRDDSGEKIFKMRFDSPKKP